MRKNDAVTRSSLNDPAFEYAPNPIIKLSRDNLILAVNKSFCDKTGYSKNKLINKNAKQVIHKEDLELLTSPILENKEDKGNKDIQGIRLIHKSGSVLETEYHGVFANSGSETITIGYFTLLQEKSQTQKKNKASEQISYNIKELPLIFKQDHIAVFQQNIEGEIISANPLFLKLTKYSWNELKNKKISTLIHPDEQEIFQNQFKNILNEKDNKLSSEYQLVTSDGSIAFTVIYYLLSKNDKHQINSVFCVVEDISEQVYMKEEMSRKIELLQKMQEIAGLGYFEYQIEANKTYWSDEIYHILGVEKGDIEPSKQSILSMVHPESRKEFEESYRELFRNKKEVKLVFRLTTPKGENKYISERVYLECDENKRPIRIQGIIQDISTLFFNQLALEESEHKYRTLVESASDAIIIAQDGLIKYSNEVLLDLFGYPALELMDKSFINFIIPEERLKVQQYHDDRMKGLGGILNYETKIITKEGRIIPIEIKSSPYTYKGKNATLAFIRDITDRKKTEEQLLLTQFGIENSQIGVFRINDKGTIKYVNQFACNSLGYSKEMLHNKNIVEIDPRFTKESWIEHQKNTKKKISSTFEALHKRKDGSVFPVEVTVNHFMFNNESYFFLFTKDITSRIEYQRVLKEKQEQLSIAMTVARLGYWEYNVVEDTFTFNDHFYSIFRTTAEEVGGYKMTSEEYSKRFLHPDDRNTVAVETAKAIATDDPDYNIHLEHRFIYSDGEVGYIAVHIFIEKDSDGNTIKTFGANQDITAQKKIENELVKAKERAEESDQLKTAFLANMSHEIRTPMNGIVGFSNMLIKPNLPDSKRLRYANIIVESCNNLMKIVNDILDISKIEAGQIEIREELFNVNSIINDLFSFHLPATEIINVSFSKYLPLSDEEATIKTDNTKLYQVLNNLVSNAIKFTHKGGIQFGYEIIPGYLRFFVKDTGIGIPFELKDKIFEHFRQGDISLNRKYGGTGLGLAISKRLVEILGGKIWVESVKNEGSTFYFTVPFDKTVSNLAIPIKESDEKTKTSEFKDMVFLVAEDEHTNFMFLKEVLEGMEIKVIHARNGQEAVDMFKNNSNIDLILMDLKMPVMNGYEAALHIKNLKPDMPVIAQTAYAMNSDKIKALQSGCDDYLSKPINQNELIRILRKFLKTSGY